MNKLHMIFGGMILATVFAVSGCGKNKMVQVSEEYAEKACACKDVDCVKKATDEYAKKIEENKDAKGSEADAKAITDAGTKAAACITKIMSAPPAAK